MARAGYRPPTARRAVQFKALNITPEWIAGFVRVGYADLSGDKLVQLKALNITPDYIAGFDRLGYRHLPVDKLVQLKALDITPEFVRSAAGGQPARREQAGRAEDLRPAALAPPFVDSSAPRDVRQKPNVDWSIACWPAARHGAPSTARS